MKVGIVGAGGMGNVHAKAYRQLGGLELSFFERHPERSEAFASRWGATAMASFEELISSVDVVDLCLPTDLHAETGKAALAAGKPVFCEKPLARDLPQATELVNAAREAKLALGVGQVVRYFPEYQAAHNKIKAGAVGTAAAIRMHRGGKFPGGSDGWFRDTKRSGGVLLDVAVHDFDWLLWTLGPVREVFARVSKTNLGAEHALTILKMESGAVAHVETTWLDPRGFSTSFEIAGSGGLLSHDSRAVASVQVISDQAVAYENNRSPEDDPYVLQLKGFLEAVSAGQEPPVTGEDGLRALAISLAAIQSAETGEKVRPPVV